MGLDVAPSPSAPRARPPGGRQPRRDRRAASRPSPHLGGPLVVGHPVAEPGALLLQAPYPHQGMGDDQLGDAPVREEAVARLGPHLGQPLAGLIEHALVEWALREAPRPPPRGRPHPFGQADRLLMARRWALFGGVRLAVGCHHDLPPSPMVSSTPSVSVDGPTTRSPTFREKATSPGDGSQPAPGPRGRLYSMEARPATSVRARREGFHE